MTERDEPTYPPKVSTSANVSDAQPSGALGEGCAHHKGCPWLLDERDAWRNTARRRLFDRDQWRDQAADLLARWHEQVTRADALETERDALTWAEKLTEQKCPVGDHPDWFINSEHTHLCPFCTIRSLNAGAEALKAEVERWKIACTEFEGAYVAEHEDRLRAEAALRQWSL